MHLGIVCSKAHLLPGSKWAHARLKTPEGEFHLQPQNLPSVNCLVFRDYVAEYDKICRYLEKSNVIEYFQWILTFINDVAFEVI